VAKYPAAVDSSGVHREVHEQIESDRTESRGTKPARCPVANTEERKDDPLSELVHVALCDQSGNQIGYCQWMSRRVVQDRNTQQPVGYRYREI
jgi:hypothetical protein